MPRMRYNDGDDLWWPRLSVWIDQGFGLIFKTGTICAFQGDPRLIFFYKLLSVVEMLVFINKVNKVKHPLCVVSDIGQEFWMYIQND